MNTAGFGGGGQTLNTEPETLGGGPGTATPFCADVQDVFFDASSDKLTLSSLKFSIVIFIHHKPRIAAAIHDL